MNFIIGPTSLGPNAPLHDVGSQTHTGRCQGLSEAYLRAEAKSEFPVVSTDFAFTKSLEEPDEKDRDETRRHGGDQRMGMSWVVVDDWTRIEFWFGPYLDEGGCMQSIAKQVVRYMDVVDFRHAP